MEITRGLRLLGLGYRGRKVQIGSTNIEHKLKKSRGRLLLLAKDSGTNTKKKLREICSNNNIACLEWGTKEEFTRIFPRETTAVLIMDSDLAKPFLDGKGRVLND